MPSHLATLATCSLDQWAMDFDGNYDRIVQSCLLAKQEGARYRLGPELEITGYGCEDHFLEIDTSDHALEVLAKLLDHATATENLLCDFGLPVVHKNVRFNCRVLCLNHRILMIRPKQALAGDGNYREERWFTRWARINQVDDFYLPQTLWRFAGEPGKRTVPFGDCYLRLNDCSVGVESCEELFTPDSPHIRLGLNGVEVIGNGSGSHHQLRKLNTRVDLIRSASQKSGGVYLYANQSGCDGGRMGYDGSALIACNGDVVAQGSQFTLADVEVITSTVNLDAVRGYRAFSSSRGVQAASSLEHQMPFVVVDWNLCEHEDMDLHISPPIPVRYHSPEEEIALGPAVWLWDYLRRCQGASGYFLPLSGGADSAATAAIVFSMCRLVAKSRDPGVVGDAMRITKLSEAQVGDARLVASRILHTAFLGTSNSSQQTENFAKTLAGEVGNYHLSVNINPVIAAIVQLFGTLGKTPKYKVHGGTYAENQALQNIQARFRMVFSYMLAQLLPWVRGHNDGFLIVLGSANVDEGLRGYLTKYDCSSADVNPIGGIAKRDLKRFLLWGVANLDLPALRGIVDQPPSAELEPITETHTQTDEEDMGCTYEELSVFGSLRKNEHLGPVSMFRRWHALWPQVSPSKIADKVKFLFRHYSVNRHKMTTITPSYHAESYSPDDNRYDLRQFLYNVKWPFQFTKIDAEAKALEQRRASLGRL